VFWLLWCGTTVAGTLPLTTTTRVAAGTELHLDAGTYNLAPGVQIILNQSSVLSGVSSWGGTRIVGTVSGDAVVKGNGMDAYNVSIRDITIINTTTDLGSSALKLMQFGADVHHVALGGGHCGLDMGGAYYSTLDHVSIQNGGAVINACFNGSNAVEVRNLSTSGGDTSVDIEGQTVALNFYSLTMEGAAQHGLVVGNDPGGAFLVNVFGGYCENKPGADCLFEGPHAPDTYAKLLEVGMRDIVDTGCHGAWTIIGGDLSGCSAGKASAQAKGAATTDRGSILHYIVHAASWIAAAF